MEKILDSLQNEGVLTDSALEKLSNILPENAKEKLHSIYQRYQELDNEEKQQFLNAVTEMFRKKMESDGRAGAVPTFSFAASEAGTSGTIPGLETESAKGATTGEVVPLTVERVWGDLQE
ncbi:hypothetical protein WN51_13015 [Melipona quadrifasciata]|uniref:Uncharacterized protein n=1 Tax=Melipona quadrifasciata TaxID=166423 RepID=A0A0N0BKF5_9HYME|nr:hypothetical protein WN51_13015 [Melipona quadrifasciata]